MANEAFAHEAEILRKLRRQQVANTCAIVVFVLAIVALAAYVIARSGAWHRPARPEAAPASIIAIPAPSRPTPRVQAPASVAAPTSVAKPAFVDPRPKLPPQPALEPLPMPMPTPRASEPRPTPPERHVRPNLPESAIATEAAGNEASSIARTSAAPAKRVLVSIKCFDRFAFERQEGGRQYFSAVCESGTRREVSCVGAGCRIEYDPPPSH